LRQLNLPGVLLPYLYSNSRQPSKKTSSLGGKLRAAIIDLRTNPPSHFEISSQEDYLEEYYIKNYADFIASGIFAVNIEEGELEIYSEKDIDLLKAKELFAGFETDHVNELIDRLRVKVFFPAAKYSAPVAVRSSLLEGNPIFGYGTLTPILGPFGLFGITAKHCLLPPIESLMANHRSRILKELDDGESIDVFGFPVASDITFRRIPESQQNIGVFTKACLSVKKDIGVVMLSELHAYSVNEVAKGVYVRFGELEEVQDAVALMPKVLKVGISTLVTVGRVCQVYRNGDFVVSSIECSVFAAGGDSGALIISSEEISFGLILGIITNVNEQGRAYCLNISAIYDIDLIKDC